MATGKALYGKSYAGNPHVRFDEGEVAPAATSRRGSLLYKSFRLPLTGLCAVCGVAVAYGRSCIVNAGTETYAQSIDRSSAQTVEIGGRKSSSPRPTDYVQETRRFTSNASAGRSLSTMPPGSIFLFR